MKGEKNEKGLGLRVNRHGRARYYNAPNEKPKFFGIQRFAKKPFKPAYRLDGCHGHRQAG
jgi:hypothetical protein